uniref:Acyltransferase 3 domain-containing protein n=1 Tax=Anopheles epiroticus TaxID=199890 RepID=A0A182PVM7_9DIPT
MPPLYLYDDYDRCLEEFPVRATYCLVDSWIVPNNSNPLWTVIEQFSTDTKRSFRHDRLQRGLCMNRCHQLLTRFDPRTQMKYFHSRFNATDSQRITFDPNTFRGALDWRNRYRRLANQCVNYELKRQYSLMAYTEVEYCTTNREQTDQDVRVSGLVASSEALDAIDVVFLFVLGMLLILTLLSTAYDCYRYRQTNRPRSNAPITDGLRDYYRSGFDRPGVSRWTVLFVAFSLPRNWHLLTTARKKASTSSKDLRFIQSVRFLVMYLVIAGHSMLFNCIFPLRNPQYVELNYRRVITMLIFNGVTVVQTYFTISGFLLAVHFVDFAEKQRTFRLRDFLQSILYRFLRSNWWANLLYVNNYLTVSEPTWYLATDFQLFVVGLAILALTWRYPKLLKPLLALAVLAALLVPATVTYVNRFDGVIILRPEALKYVLWYDPMYRKMYIPAHTNVGSYLAGLIAGLLYHRLKRAAFAANRHRGFLALWYASLPAAIVLLLSAYIFYAYEFEQPALWIAAYAAISKNLWGALFGVLFVGLAFGVGGFLRRALNNSIFRPLGKVTYCVFLCHLFVIRCTLGNIRQPIYVSDMRILVATSSTLVLAYIMGTLMCVLIEIPFSNVQKTLFFFKQESEYWKMPQLQVYDSIEQCLHNKPDGVFCIAKVVIKPNSRSEVWRLIKKYSKYTFQYNHDVLTRGVCLERCNSVLQQLGQVADRYYEPKFNVSKRYAISDWLLPNVTNYRQAYGYLINVCQNYDLRTRFNLSGYAEIEECTTNENLHRPLDTLDITYIVLLAALFLLAISSQCYDSWLARKSGDENYYGKSHKSRVATLATAFSIRRNWTRLTYKATRSQYQQDLDFLDQIRVLTMSFILLLHVFIGMAMFTAQNPLAMEQMLFSMAPFQVDMFFCISGLLLTVQFLEHTENKRFRISILWQGLINRYLRSLPVYAVLMLFTVSRYDTYQTTPSAYKIMPKVRLICRQKWWINFLYINNYYQPEEQCLIHTWYLAADFQLFVVGLLVLTMLWRFPKATFWTAMALGVVGFVLPMVNTYLHAMDAMMPLTMKGNEYQLWYDEYFVKSYQATETHCCSYVCGMIAGLLYNKITRKEIKLPIGTIRNVFTLASIAIIGFALQAPLYNMMQFAKPSLWMAILSGVHKLSIGSFYSMAFLLLTFHDRKSAVRRWFSGSALSRAMARLGFGFYLVQMTVLKVVFGNYPEDTRINVQLIVSTFCSTFILSYSIALFAFIFIEKPFDVLFKLLLSPVKTRRTETEPASVSKQSTGTISVISSAMGAGQENERAKRNGSCLEQGTH